MKYSSSLGRSMLAVAAKPSTRMTIRDHLASYMSEGGFLIVSPYEQNVAESVYRTLMNKANGLNKYKRVVTPEICERALRVCICRFRALWKRCVAGFVHYRCSCSLAFSASVEEPFTRGGLYAALRMDMSSRISSIAAVFRLRATKSMGL